MCQLCRPFCELLLHSSHHDSLGATTRSVGFTDFDAITFARAREQHAGLGFERKRFHASKVVRGNVVRRTVFTVRSLCYGQHLP
jgi:hypothetical protein